MNSTYPQRESKFDQIKQYCVKRAEQENAYLFVLGWSYDLASTKRNLKESLSWHSEQIERYPNAGSTESNRRDLAATQDVLEKFFKVGDIV